MGEKVLQPRIAFASAKLLESPNLKAWLTSIASFTLTTVSWNAETVSLWQVLRWVCIQTWGIMVNWDS